MTASGDVTHAHEEAAPKPGLFRSIALMLMAFVGGFVGWTAMIAMITLLVRYCAFITQWAWNVGR